jgi:hypothetical protein
MKKYIIFIFVILFFMTLVYAQESRVYNIHLNYNKGVLNLIDISVIPGEFKELSGKSDISYKAIVSDFKNNLNDYYFEIPLIINSDELDPETKEPLSKEIVLDKTDFYLKIPYNPYAKKISLFNSNDTNVLEINVQGFSKNQENPLNLNKWTFIILTIIIVIIIIIILKKIFYKR